MRPVPPKDISTFIPAFELSGWVLDTFLSSGSKLHNEDHAHLFAAIESGQIHFMWAPDSYESKGRIVLGQTEQLAFRGNKWSKWRQMQQFAEWFGLDLPDYLITLSAAYWLECDDIEACAITEHELYHICHALDSNGQLAFDKTGNPRLGMRGHDVEEFVGVVRRYGAVDPAVKELARFASQKPEIAAAHVAAACGTCLKLVA